MGSPRRVLLLGWDAADWKIIGPLMDEGKMPYLESLARQGVVGNLSTLYPVLSPMLWTSIATGKRAHKHGIHGFSEPDPQSGGVRPITNLGRRSKAIWNILQQNGLRSNVVAWWPSHPVEPINGVMVSNHYQQSIAPVNEPWPMRPGTIHPPHLAEHLKDFRIHPGELEGEVLLPFVPGAAEIDQKKDKRLAGVARIIAETASVHAAATALMQLEPWDFMGVYFDGIDHFCHGFMKYHPPKLDWIPNKDFDLYKEVVNAGYQFHDQMLGTYLHLAGDDTTVIIVSDHGFHPDHLRPRELPSEPAGPAEEHRQFGIIAMKGPGIKRNDQVYGASLLDVTPTILSLYGLAVGDDMDGKPLMGAFLNPPQIPSIPSWDRVEGNSGLHAPGAQSDPVDQHEALRQLVDLGYIDKPDENLEKAAATTVRELQYNLARDYMDSGDLVEASAILCRLWDADPDEGRFGFHLLHCQLGLARLREAQATLERMEGEKQRCAAAAIEELKAWKKKHEATRAKEGTDLEISDADRIQLNRLRRKASTNLHTFAFLRGRILSSSGQFEAALAEFEKAREVHVHNLPNLYQYMGDCAFALGRLEEAEQHYNAIRVIDPINAQSRLGLCRVYLARHASSRALDYATAAIGLVHNYPQAHYLCARALTQMGRTSDAITALHTALSLNPVYPHAHRLLATLHRQRQNHGKAIEHRALARAALVRIRDYRRGNPLPEDRDLQLDLDLHKPASVAHLSTEEGLPALDEDTIVVVSGLPRSGTSMMMQMLAASGLPILSDHKRSADGSNQRGYLEFEPVKGLGRSADTAWLGLANGKAVKIVAPLLPHLPAGRPYRIIFMERPLKEIVRSQAAMLEASSKQGGRLSERKLAATYLQQVKQVSAILSTHGGGAKILAVNYLDTVASPAATARRLNRFLGGNLDEAAMAEAVVPDLRRQREEAP